MLQWKLQTNTSQSESIVSLFDLSYQSGSRTLKAPRVMVPELTLETIIYFALDARGRRPVRPPSSGPRQ